MTIKKNIKKKKKKKRKKEKNRLKLLSLTALKYLIDHSTFVLIVSVGNARIKSRLDMIYPDLTKLQTIFTEENFRIQRKRNPK